MADPQPVDVGPAGRSEPPMPAHIADVFWARLLVIMDLANLGAERRRLVAELEVLDRALAVESRR